MGNMSYCRFQNTEKDLRECAVAVEEMNTNHNLSEEQAEEQEAETWNQLSHDEKHALQEMVGLAKEFLEEAEALLEDNL